MTQKNRPEKQSLNVKLKPCIGVLKKIQQGYGFIRQNGKEVDVFVSLAEFGQAGITRKPFVGMELRFDKFDSCRGPRATNLIWVPAGSNKATVSPIRASKEAEEKSPNYNATIKFFDWEKCFGFVARVDGGKDEFIHKSVIIEAGVEKGSDLKGRKAWIVTGPGIKKGTTQVTRIELI